MIVLHAAFCDSSLLLWGESSEESSLASRRRRKDPLAAYFDAGPARLAAIAAELGIELKVRTRATREAVAWLPSTKNQPVPSGTLITDEPLSADSCRLEPWIITVLPLDLKQSLSLLMACGTKRLVRPGLLVGADLAFWNVALRFAAGLVMRGQFLPGVKVEDGDFRARWQPVFSGPDARRMHALAQAMPAAARAVVWDASESLPSAQTVLCRFLEIALDGLIRSSPDVRKEGAIDSIHDQWIYALTGQEGAMPRSSVELEVLAAQVQQWQRPIQVSTRAPFRLCFRLEEPKDDSEVWLVRYLLQGTRDPSLILSASEAWNPKPNAASPLGRDVGAAREHLLASLGQAAGIYARIEESLRERTPNGCRLDVTGAHEFLREKAAALERSGFGVMLPAWWTRKGAQTRIKVGVNLKSPARPGDGRLSLESIVEFDWELALGEEKISGAELAALAGLKAPLVRLRGQWVEVNSAEIQAALEFVTKRASDSGTLRDVIQMAVGAVEFAGALELDRVTATGWAANVLAQLQGNTPFEELPQPAGLEGTLRPYQRRGYSWLHFLKRWGLGACLADDMGLGKTIQALADFGGRKLAAGSSAVHAGSAGAGASRRRPPQRCGVPHGGVEARHRSFQLLSLAPRSGGPARRALGRRNSR
jgi:hypothetical protein